MPLMYPNNKRACLQNKPGAAPIFPQSQRGRSGHRVNGAKHVFLVLFNLGKTRSPQTNYSVFCLQFLLSTDIKRSLYDASLSLRY